MFARARDAVVESGTTNVELRQADAEQRPMRDGEIDVALVNGAFNLNPARDAIFSELARVVRFHSWMVDSEVGPPCFGLVLPCRPRLLTPPRPAKTVRWKTAAIGQTAEWFG
ncbi:MAG: methyltransferase domain-containing protein [Terriglobia bacterium]